MTRLRHSSALALAAALVFSPLAAFGQAAPTSIPGVMDICTPVIEEQYEGDQSRRGFCVNATDGFLTGVRTSSSADELNQTIADLILELVELYRPDPECLVAETELPEAIERAASFSTDEEQRILIEEIAESIRACLQLATAAIPAPELASEN